LSIIVTTFLALVQAAVAPQPATLAPVAAASVPQRDWAAALREDARALHDDIAANHPGPVNALDPDFAKRNDVGLALALKRAEKVRDQGGYAYAMWGYATSFDDGHLGVFTADKAAPMPSRWPGFLTGIDATGAQVVMNREDRAPVPIGARLVGCDNRPADRLAAENVGAFVGRWMLASQRVLTGGQLFADFGNPFIARPSRCTFMIDGKQRTVALDWQPISPSAMNDRLAETSKHTQEPIGQKSYADGTRWFTLSGFNGDPNGDDAKALQPLIAAIKADRDAIVTAPRIVLDLRGNGGGSSDWSSQIARILWGDGRVDGLIDNSYVEWRVSDTNLKTLEDYQRQYDRPDTDASIRRYFNTLVTGVRRAGAVGRALWREPTDIGDSQKKTLSGNPPVPPAQVYFVTDSVCASACLDAADLWKSLGAIQVGQETSADTLYMDVRNVTLPSGVMGAAIPMKVYRGRERGANVPMEPVHRYPGDLRNTATLEGWIAALKLIKK
jgi:hypothetical protein